MNALLEQYANRWKKNPAVDSSLADKLIEWIQSSDPIQRNRMNAYQIAASIHETASDTVTQFLYGVQEGLFNLHWDVHCPHCNMVTIELDSLHDASYSSRCEMCDQDFHVDFAERVEVTFSLNQEIEKLDLPPVCIPPKKLKPKYSLSALKGESATGTEYLNSGPYRYICPITLSIGFLDVQGDPVSEIQKITIEQLENRTFSPERIEIRPGPVEIEFKNIAYPAAGLYIFRNDLKEPIEFQDLPVHLTGLELVHYPAFQKLFGSEVLSRRERMQISSIAVLFTDITGSTAMYEKLGDAKAYNVVRDHYEILFDAVEKNGGRIVKTIGDAVMASFRTSAPGLESVIQAVEEFEKYNSEKPWPVKIKMGLHRGPAILVNLNDSLDYFGGTINRAARMQGVSNSNEISFSDDVLNDPGIKQRLKEKGIRKLRRRRMILKGIDEPQVVYTAPLLQE